MQRIQVKGADGSTALLALVKREAGSVYACPLARYDEVMRGKIDSVVGFPEADVRTVS